MYTKLLPVYLSLKGIMRVGGQPFMTPFSLYNYTIPDHCLQGRKTKFWPELSDFHPIRLNVTSSTEEQLHLDGLSLQNGAAYSVKVTAINRAKMATAEESEGVTVDTTPPVVLGVSWVSLFLV